MRRGLNASDSIAQLRGKLRAAFDSAPLRGYTLMSMISTLED
jgi:hypothetical protein